MTIVYIDHEVSPALAKEIEILGSGRLDPNDPTKREIAEVIQEFPSTICGFELIEQLKRYPIPLKILDIGCGPGFSSIYMALQGHQVSALEPSPFDCKVLETNAAKMNVQIPIYQCTAEVINRIPEAQFDLCIFNSSLHHCEDPCVALQHCYQKLKARGKILLINEPILKFYRSKKWFERALVETPEKMGHYGGNEHIYYYSEYKKMLKQAGFQNIVDILNFRLRHPRLYIQNLFPVQINGVYINGDLKLLMKFFYLLMLQRCLKLKIISKPLIALLKKLSFLQVTFEAVKN